MTVWIVHSYRYDWDEPQIVGVFSTKDLADQYVPVVRAWLDERDMSTWTVYVEDYAVDEQSRLDEITQLKVAV